MNNNCYNYIIEDAIGWRNLREKAWLEFQAEIVSEDAHDRVCNGLDAKFRESVKKELERFELDLRREIKNEILRT